jgi:hypothetical protein
MELLNNLPQPKGTGSNPARGLNAECKISVYKKKSMLKPKVILVFFVVTYKTKRK